jgi:protein-tyrosine phosphatase
MPWIDLDGAVNVRDLGGLPTVDGEKTAAGRLLRGDNLQDLSAADVTKLAGEIGVSTVVDLRTNAELGSLGPAPLDAVPGVSHLHFPVLLELRSDPNVIAEAIRGRTERDQARYPANPEAGHYLGYLEERPDQVAAAVRAIATAPGAAIVHCAAGKDRTGVITALALSAVGVLSDAIVADYTATNERLTQIFARLTGAAIYAADLDGRPLDAHRARPETMTDFLSVLDTRYGGATGWLASNGFTAEDLTSLRAKLLDRA